MKSLIIQAPAKVNLYLKILGKRSDGFHELLTVFHRISLCDSLTLKKSSSGFKLNTRHSALTNSKKNIIYRAYQLLKELNLFKGSVHVALKKRIPVAAGLGGGSSDAAHFLLGMNQLFELGLPLRTLSRLGRQLGSDVPFFLYQLNQAIGQGRGEILTPYPYQGRLWFVIIAFPFSLKTPEVYRTFSEHFGRKIRSKAQLTRISPSATITSDFFRRFSKGPVSRLRLKNDLFQASVLLRPELGRMDAFLSRLNVDFKLLSGSGPTMFSVHPSKREAHKLAQRLKRSVPDLRVFICHTY